MAGGTHADHSNVEAWLGITLSATSKPLTDAQVDAMCVAAEAAIKAELEPSNSLPASADTTWRQIVCEIVENMMKKADAWHRARGASSEGGEQDGTATFPSIGNPAITPTIRRKIKNYERRMTTHYSVRYGESQD